MIEQYVVLQSTDPRVLELKAEGYVLAGESWGARLSVTGEEDLKPMWAAIDHVARAGVTVRELRPEHAESVRKLEAENHADYPFSPATEHPRRDLHATKSLWSDGYSLFGAFHADALIGVTAIKLDGDHAETEFTSVSASHRRQGVGSAVKSASIIAMFQRGGRMFGTGGAQINASSIAVNSALGYVLVEKWLSFTKPEKD